MTTFSSVDIKALADCLDHAELRGRSLKDIFTAAERRALSAALRAATLSPGGDTMKALRKLAIVQRHVMAYGGTTNHVGFVCKVCGSEWDRGQPEQHENNCCAALSAFPPAQADGVSVPRPHSNTALGIIHRLRQPLGSGKMAEHTPTPWTYRSKVHDDWGWIRDADGNLAATARDGRVWLEHFDSYRATKTDPYEPNAAFIVKAVNNHDALVAELKRLFELYGHQAAADILAAVERPSK